MLNSFALRLCRSLFIMQTVYHKFNDTLLLFVSFKPIKVFLMIKILPLRVGKTL